MTVLGCTGHQFLTDGTRTQVAREVLHLILQSDPSGLVGTTSLAEGADQVFALAVLAAGGTIDVIIPSAGYEAAFPTEASARIYRTLLSLAHDVTMLPFNSPSEDAFLAAGYKVVDEADELIAVWDGRPAAGKGGTGDIVAYAKNQGKKVHIVWPAGAVRTR